MSVRLSGIPHLCLLTGYTDYCSKVNWKSLLILTLVFIYHLTRHINEQGKDSSSAGTTAG